MLTNAQELAAKFAFATLDNDWFNRFKRAFIKIYI
jgi:hypothetical protein